MVGNCIDATIKYSEDIIKEELDPYLRIDQEIIFRVKSFDLSNFFIDGIVDQKCLDKIKELITLSEEFNGLFANRMKWNII